MKGGEEKKAAVALVVFIIATLEIFGRKILFWQNILLAVTLSQNLARYATWSITRGGSNTHLSQGNKRDSSNMKAYLFKIAFQNFLAGRSEW